MTTAKKPSSSSTPKGCEQIVRLLLDYLNNKLSAKVKKEFEHHLDLCPDCVSFLNTYKKTIQATGTVNDAKVPAQVRDNILKFLRKQMRRARAIILCGFTQFFA